MQRWPAGNAGQLGREERALYINASLRRAHAQVFVLLFGVGEAETEGIYSLRAMSREEGLPQDTIVAFEDLEDAERCAPLL